VKGKRKILTPSREKSVINWTWLTELNWTELLAAPCFWLANHNDWSKWFVISNLPPTYRPICSTSFSFFWGARRTKFWCEKCYVFASEDALRQYRRVRTNFVLFSLNFFFLGENCGELCFPLCKFELLLFFFFFFFFKNFFKKNFWENFTKSFLSHFYGKKKPFGGGGMCDFYLRILWSSRSDDLP
jgi:hypothetical protein